MDRQREWDNRYHDRVPGNDRVRPPSFRGVGPKNYQRADERVLEDVCERLTDDHDVDASEIEVTVANGIVTLAGAVSDRRTKRLAEDIALTVNGVRDVHNNLKVERSDKNR